MKHALYLLLFFFLIGLCACKENTYPRVLLLADSLTSNNPDSAVCLLRSIKGMMLSEPESTQMYYRLLSIKAYDKAFIPLTSDSLILPVLHYYINRNDKRHLPEAYYYAGRIYRDLGDAPQALNYFEKALDAMGNDSCYDFRSQIHSQMGRIFSEQGIWEEARKLYSHAYRWSVLERDSISMIYDLRDLASTFCGFDGIDSSLTYYQKAYDLACALKNPRIMDMVQSQIAGVYERIRKYDLVKCALQPSWGAAANRLKTSIYSIAADVYHKIGNKDSSAYYYNELLSSGTLFTRTDAHWHLAEIALEKEKPQEAKEHLEQYIAGMDSIQRIVDTETVREISSLYNYTLRETENNSLKAENKQKRAYLTYAITGSIIAMLCFIAYIQYSRRKHAQLNLQLLHLKQLKEEQYQRSALFIEENKRKQQELTQLLLDESYPKLQKQQMGQQKQYLYYAGKQAEYGLQEREQAREKLFSSDVYKYFRDLCNQEGNIQVRPEMWSLLENTINSTYQGFTDKLFRISRISPHELRICFLIKINILPKDMARLTNRSRESITSVRRRLYEKFFGKKGTPQQWDEFIDLL